MDTLSSIIRNEVLNDKISNLYLKEDMQYLNEFQIIRKLSLNLESGVKMPNYGLQGYLIKF